MNKGKLIVKIIMAIAAVLCLGNIILCIPDLQVAEMRAAGILNIVVTVLIAAAVVIGCRTALKIIANAEQG